MLYRLLTAVCLLLPLDGFADFDGEVFSVSSADTIQVLRYGQPVRVKIAAIQSPPWSSKYAREAREELEDMVGGKDVTVKTEDLGLIGGVYGEVFLKGGGNVGHRMVQEGLARWDRNADPNNTVLEQLEREARDAQVGLWRDSDAVKSFDSEGFARNEDQFTGAVQVIKKDNKGRCITPGSPGYEDLEDYTGFSSIRACVDGGGKLTLPQIPIGRFKIID